MIRLAALPKKDSAAIAGSMECGNVILNIDNPSTFFVLCGTIQEKLSESNFELDNNSVHASSLLNLFSITASFNLYPFAINNFDRKNGVMSNISCSFA
jgi:hypothetical protein